ncbi:MAG: glycerol-3-phosphate 1-O-acyltransferase PlsB [Xanthomonadales bacterium]|nr:glycerol-3-phosphate 1-O-acyltransferase PlsB [Xanthomonadales bacterium]
MTAGIHNTTFLARLKLRWQLFLRWVLNLWVRAQVLPDADGNTGVPDGAPVCYVMADYALSSVLILDEVCDEIGIDRPLLPLRGLEGVSARSYATLRRWKGLVVRRPVPRRHSETLATLIQYCEAHPDADVQIVPVSVLIGRAPDKADGVAKVLFTEDWEVIGRFRRLLSTIINGRDTVVQFSRPISLRELLDEGVGSARALRKVSRILRTHFRRVKASVIGPDLSHRRTMIDRVVQSAAVREAIVHKAERDGISQAEATAQARDYALEIAANYSYTFVRVAYFVLNWFLRRIYGETRAYHFERFKEQALGREIVYVPCHRSHADYILLSFLLYVRGLAVPHIAAGINLNLPVVGSILRMGGAFYLRRSFRAQKLYSAVFSEYVSQILSDGVPIEYFIEGTRSRTGRLLPPKGGMLAMTVRGYLRQPTTPVMFQPVYIGYEKLLEGSSYTQELAGAAKKKESLLDLFKVHRILRKNYGEAHVSFGEPILLDDVLEEFDPAWREASGGVDEKPSWMTPLVNELGDRIMRRINATADVNPVNLLASVMLATPRHAIDEQELRAQISLYQALLRRGPLGEQVTITEKDAIEVVSHGFDLRLLERVEHPLGDVIRVARKEAVSLTYFRNNTAHLLAVPSLVACCFLRRRTLQRATLDRLTREIYPYLRAELFLPWAAEDFPRILDHTLKGMAELGLLEISDDSKRVRRAEGGTMQAGQINLLARFLLNTLERYYITLAVLAKNGSGTLNRPELEQLCIQTAQRISLLQEFEAPEFYDKGLFKQFIQVLRNQGVLRSNDAQRIEFDRQVESMSRDARLFLEKGIRHSIIQAAAHQPALEAPRDAQASMSGMSRDSR